MAADAHDAGRFGAARWEGWRLMLMMLARLGRVAADAHDAGLSVVVGEKGGG